MAFNVESQVKSGLGQLVWLKLCGPFDTEAEAMRIADRVAERHSLTTRIVAAPCPPADALDELYEGRPCRIVARARQPSPGHGRISLVTVEFADGSQQIVSKFHLRKARL